MKHVILSTFLGATLTLPAFAQDAANGEAEFRKCKACHMIQTPAGEDIVRGGGIGPNLYNIVGRKIGAQQGYAYGDGILAVAQAKPDLVWTEAELAAYMTNPGDWLKQQSGDDSVRSKMTFRLNKDQADIAAYLATVSPGAQ